MQINGEWLQPRAATPTSHILKLPLGLIGNMRADMSLSVENEWLCAQILAALGLPVAQTSMARFGAQKVLVVERFDRKWMDQHTWLARLPQEDFCQASGLPGSQKYENQGGPGMAQCLTLLGSAQNPAKDKQTFVLTQLAFWLLAATDGHAKNFSLFLHPGGSHTLTPLYDVLSAWPIIGQGGSAVSLHKAKLAMALRGQNTHYKLIEIQNRHWRALAEQSGAPTALAAMCAMVDNIDAALEQVASLLPAGFPEKLFLAIAQGMRGQRQRFFA